MKPWLPLALVVGLWGCGDERVAQLEANPVEREPLLSDEVILPIPETVPLDPRKVDLGRRLFRDPILSRERDTTCLNCHPFAAGGMDGATRSQLPGRAKLGVNTPTIFNVGFSFKLHWSGRFDSLEAQLDVPIMNPNVMNMTFPEIVERLKASPEFAPTFNAIYGGVSEANFREALATYERSLNTPGARFDRFLRGETDAIDDDERRGFELFKSHGCSSCHQGVNVGGNLLQRFGVLKDYFAGRTIEEADLGLYTVTKLEADKHVFRVPSLRNVALTAPYFHNGSVQTLDEAVRIMAEYQLGRPLAAEQTRLIVAFLGTLTSDLEQVQ
jgi:cytochrome c peroxidase